MVHAIHTKGIVLFEDCEECKGRTHSLWDIDTPGLEKLSHLAGQLKHPPTEASTLDLVAADHLRLLGRVVYRSGVTRLVCL
jgi:hypothetical protein